MRVKKLNILLFVVLGVLYILSFSWVSDNVDYWILDFFSHFPFQYAILASMVLAVCLWKRAMIPAVLAGLLLLFNLSAVLDTGGAVQASGRSSDTFTVYSANIHKKNMELSVLKREIMEMDPEIVLLLEVSPGHEELLQSLIQSYPHYLQNIYAKALGFVFLSKFPVRDHHFTTLSRFGNSLLEATLEINHKSVKFYGMHAQRPNRENFGERKKQFFGPVRQLNEQSYTAIVAGDFNTTPYTPFFRKLIRIGGLKDSREGFGWQPSWPTSFPPFWLPIDHVLVTPDIQVHTRKTGSYIGSDHYPVIAELSLNQF